MKKICMIAVCAAMSCQMAMAQKAGFSEITRLEQFGGSSSSQYAPSQAEKERIAWWRDAKFGMFMHWGLYSQMAGYWKGEKVTGGEWAIKMHKLPIEEYRELAKEFNPVKFDAEAWVKLIKAAGMKYLVITAKHHDGFAMYKSAVSPYNIVDATPFGRDPMKELKEACDKYGIKFGLYYSHAQDWNEPDGYGNNWSWPGYKRDFNKYLDEKSIPQIKELCDQYHPAILWFDTPGDMTMERAYQISDICRSRVPDVLINSRIMLGKPVGLPLSDYESGGDNEAFGGYREVPWELCGTLNRSWAYKKWDTDFRPVKELLSHLIDAVSKNGNYLLNVGPTAEGEILEPYSSRLLAIGEWLKVNGEAIYGCGGTLWGTEYGEYVQEGGKRKFVAKPAVWRCTSKENSIYIHILDWPENGQIELPAVDVSVKKVALLGKKMPKVTFSQSADGRILLQLPAESADVLVPVVKLSW